MSGDLMGHETDFQTSVTRTLARLETKMDLLVGPDGNNGKISAIEGRLDQIESTQDQDAGRRQGLGWVKTLAASTLGVGAGAAIQKLLR
jgi:hypothetical protein